MRLHSALGFLGLSYLATASQLRPRNYEAQDYYVLELDSATAPVQIALKLGLTHEGQLGELKDHHIFSCRKQAEDIVKTAIQERRRRKRSLGGLDPLDGVKFAQKQKLKARLEKRGPIPPPPPGYIAPVYGRQGAQPDGPTAEGLLRQKEVMQKLEIADPIFKDQWHLYNSVQIGHDVNVTDVWMQGITGHNSTVAIVDDGLDMYSDDLKANYFAEGSYDFNDHTLEPRPRLSDDRHGTRCAGEVSAVKNNVCGVGVAWDSKIAGIRILSKMITDADEAIALNYAYQDNQIYSCSWGPPDDGRSMDAPGILIRKAMLNAVQNGRGGLGSVYVFASGNGAGSDDNCNFDGYTNSIYSITIGAVDRKGLHPYYSEKCSAQLVVTYSSGSGDAIHTTDVGTNVCSTSHGGTSAAAPLAAGIFALVLQVRPDLTWRDLQYLVMQTALPIDVETGEWQTTTIGRKFSHTFGYGKIDTWATIEAAKTFVKVKPQSWYYSPWIHVNQTIPEGEKGLAVSLEVTDQMLKEANLARLEHVTVTMNVKHTRRGDLSVDLISPAKLVSHISTTRRYDTSTEGYDDWTFMSVVHWGELGVGTWTIVIKDTVVNEFNGTFVDWHLKLWGESIDASKATVLPMPTDQDDDDHDKIISSTTTITGSTTHLPSATDDAASSHPTTKPVDHPERPTKTKPSPTSAAPADEATSTPSTTASPSSWLPSFFPTFGVSSKTQIWIYGSAALMLIFCTGLAIYLYLARRKRLRNNPRDEWEFDLLREDGDDGDEGKRGLMVGTGGMQGKGKGRRRAGELYDAFAEGSESESGLDSGDERYVDGDGDGLGLGVAEGGDEREKRLYEEDEELRFVGESDDGGEESEVEGRDDEKTGRFRR